jgi:hypothetical protein
MARAHEFAICRGLPLGGVTRAAQKLHITQSALSARISSLEEELGVVLVDRRNKQFRLTIAGQRRGVPAHHHNRITLTSNKPADCRYKSWLTGIYWVGRY